MAKFDKLSLLHAHAQYICIVYVKYEKEKMEKEGKNNSQHIGFLSHNIADHSQGAYQIWRLWLS